MLDTRDDDKTLIDIKFAHDVLDPSIAPEAHAIDLVDPSLVTDDVDAYNHLGFEPDALSTSGLVGFVGGVFIICVIYGMWLMLQRVI